MQVRLGHSVDGVAWRLRVLLSVTTPNLGPWLGSDSTLYEGCVG